MEYNYPMKRDDAVSQAMRLAPNTLKCASVGGVFGALLGGSKGALVGLVVGAVVGYGIDNPT